MRYFIAEVYDSADIPAPSTLMDFHIQILPRGKWDVFSVDDKGFVQGLSRGHATESAAKIEAVRLMLAMKSVDVMWGVP